MKLKIFSLFIFFLLTSQTSVLAKTIRLYAGPNTWGPPVTIASCLGTNVSTSYSEGESQVGGVVLYQARIHGVEWFDAPPGQVFIGQVVEVRAKVNWSTGGYVDIEVKGACEN